VNNYFDYYYFEAHCAKKTPLKKAYPDRQIERELSGYKTYPNFTRFPRYRYVVHIPGIIRAQDATHKIVDAQLAQLEKHASAIDDSISVHSKYHIDD
jgi:hypothetical protein